METEDLSKKEIVFTQVVKTIFLLEFEFGHLKWTITHLSELAGVSRNLIYHYLGSTKKEILKTSFIIYYKDILSLDKGNSSESIASRIIAAKKKLDENPSALGFLFNFARCSDEYKEVIDQIEEQYIAKLKRQLPESTPEQFYTFRLLIFAAVKYKYIDDGLIETLVSRFLQMNWPPSQEPKPPQLLAGKKNSTS